jgi:hypothetical protein
MKRTNKIVRISAVTLFTIIYMLVLIKPSFTFPSYMKAARAQSYPAANCSYCHLTIDTGRGWNERGLWLIDQKKKHKADKVDVAWLKDYRPSGDKDAQVKPKVETKATPEPAKPKN